MPRKYPAEVRHQVIELARSGTKFAQLAATFGMRDAYRVGELTIGIAQRLGRQI